MIRKRRSWPLDAGFILCVSAVLFAGNANFDFPVENQHTYMVHAFRLLGRPGLAEDWLAHTLDPAPLATLLSALAFRLGGAAGLSALYFGCCLVFVACWHWIAVQRCQLDAPGRLIALPILLLPFFNPFNPWLAHGVAGQYLLGGYWQPSEAAGAVLVLAFTLFVQERPFPAVAAAGLAATLHPGSLLPASIIAGTVVLDRMVRRRWRRAAGVALAYAACVLPVVVFSLVLVKAGAPDSTAEGARILVHERIPHHTLPVAWLGPGTAFCVGLVLAAIIACRDDRRIAFGLAMPLGAGVLLSIAAVLIDRDIVYLTFPWRISALLVPLAWLLLSIAAARSATRILRLRFGGYSGFAQWAATVPGRGAAMVLMLAGAAAATHSSFARTESSKGYPQGLIAWVDTETAANTVFIVPPELEWFRLNAGRPVLADWKSHPYRGDEVVEWHRRIEQSQRIMAAFCRTGRLPVEAAEAASFVVIDRSSRCQAEIAAAAYADADFAVFRTTPGH
jgi:hypothetical protein